MTVVKRLEKGTPLTQEELDGNFDDYLAHKTSTANPHSVTKAQVGLSDVDNTSDANKPVSTSQGVAIANAVSDAESYTDAQISAIKESVPVGGNTLNKLYNLVYGKGALVGSFDASSGALPTTGNGTSGAIIKGDYWDITVAGTLPSGVTPNRVVKVGDVITARVNNASSGSQFYVTEGNQDQATEYVQGISKIATQAIIEDETSTNDVDIVTTKKFWFGIVRMKAIAQTISGLWSFNYLGFLKQGSVPSAYAYSTDGVKAFFNSSGAMSWISRFGTSIFTKSMNQFENVIGEIVNDSFDRTTSGYSLTGSNISQSIVSNELNIANSTGNTNYTNYVSIGKTVWYWNVEQTIRFIPSSNGNGIGIGFLHTNLVGYAARIDLNSAGNRGTFGIYRLDGSGVPTQVAISATNAISYTNGDILYLSFAKEGQKLTATCWKDGQSPKQISWVDTLASAVTATALNNSVKIFSLGGTQKIQNYTLKSSDKKNQKLVLVGDSRFYGYNSQVDNFSQIATQLIGNEIVGGCNIICASGGRLTEIESIIDSVIALNSEYIAICLGANDAVSPVLSANDYETSCLNIINACKPFGIKVIFFTVPPTTDGTRNTNISGFNTKLLGLANVCDVVDIAPSMTVSTVLDPVLTTDGTHYNQAGNIKLANLVLDGLTWIRVFGWKTLMRNESKGGLVPLR